MSSEEITIYDDEFTWGHRQHMFNFFMNSSYRFTRIEQNHKEACMVSTFTGEDMKKLGLLEKKKDYKLRADNFKKKEKRIFDLKRKAEFKNPDEF